MSTATSVPVDARSAPPADATPVSRLRSRSRSPRASRSHSRSRSRSPLRTGPSVRLSVVGLLHNTDMVVSQHDQRKADRWTGFLSDVASENKQRDADEARKTGFDPFEDRDDRRCEHCGTLHDLNDPLDPPCCCEACVGSRCHECDDAKSVNVEQNTCRCSNCHTHTEVMPPAANTVGKQSAKPKDVYTYLAKRVAQQQLAEQPAQQTMFCANCTLSMSKCVCCANCFAAIEPCRRPQPLARCSDFCCKECGMPVKDENDLCGDCDDSDSPDYPPQSPAYDSPPLGHDM